MVFICLPPRPERQPLPGPDGTTHHSPGQSPGAAEHRKLYPRRRSVGWIPPRRSARPRALSAAPWVRSVLRGGPGGGRHTQSTTGSRAPPCDRQSVSRALPPAAGDTRSAPLPRPAAPGASRRHPAAFRCPPPLPCACCCRGCFPRRSGPPAALPPPQPAPPGLKVTSACPRAPEPLSAPAGERQRRRSREGLLSGRCGTAAGRSRPERQKPPPRPLQPPTPPRRGGDGPRGLAAARGARRRAGRPAAGSRRARG